MERKFSEEIIGSTITLDYIPHLLGCSYFFRDKNTLCQRRDIGHRVTTKVDYGLMGKMTSFYQIRFNIGIGGQRERWKKCSVLSLKKES